MGETKLSKAISTLVDALKNDPDYRYAWQANIAMSFQDEFARQTGNEGDLVSNSKIHRIANKSADNFLKLLCQDRE